MFKLFVYSIFQWCKLFFTFLKAFFMSSAERSLENLALRSQVAVYQQREMKGKISKPRVDSVFRQLWVLLSKIYPNWKESLVIVKPETVISWYKTAFKAFWKRKSKKAGRPSISPATIALIKRIYKENPLLSPEKIYEKLISLNIIDAPCPNTIAKYITRAKKSPANNKTQSWKTFLKNHCKDIWAIDFFTVPTLTFKVLYVLLIVSHNRRKIEHFAVTLNPDSAWVCQQIRNATPFGEGPKYIIHDNDSIFVSEKLQKFLENSNIKSKRIGYHAPWQNGICERTIGILRQELLNHVIPLNQRHLEKLLKEYIEKYYNTERTHQGIACKTPVLKEKPVETKVCNTVLNSKPLLGGLYRSYHKVA